MNKQKTKNNIEYSEVLKNIKLKSKLSIVLYIFLKRHIEFEDWKENEGKYKLALPYEVNVKRLAEYTCISKNTVKKSLIELLEIGLIEKIDWLKPRHSACYMVLIKNDALIDRFDETTGKVVYTDSLSFNFGVK